MGITRLGHLTASTVEELAEVTGVRSTRVLHGLQKEVWQSLPPSLWSFAQDRALASEWRKGQDYVIDIIVASAKLAIWKSRENKVDGEGITDCTVSKV